MNKKELEELRKFGLKDSIKSPQDFEKAMLIGQYRANIVVHSLNDPFPNRKMLGLLHEALFANSFKSPGKFADHKEPQLKRIDEIAERYNTLPMWKLNPEQKQFKACEYHHELSYLNPFEHGFQKLNQTILNGHLQRFTSKEKQLFIDDKQYQHAIKLSQTHDAVSPLNLFVKDNFVNERIYRIRTDGILSLFREKKGDRER